ncbi:2-hydroxycarboxylate transporter family protein [Candidatus Phytoplasma pini]|uniref:Malate (Citrate)/Na+ symporter n=1 Tax=Candidatus Phytoplasma pini TaxID=267362 RepID=A0A559KJK4_9MOLU|nr:2-hydroxycarboxylate transporter family protein [Candidatus Phytoplasma pini]TVY12312.1 Malate (citrate)/Na+ symporter [Candidatus Phytoplasma pini]
MKKNFQKKSNTDKNSIILNIKEKPINKKKEIFSIPIFVLIGVLFVSFMNLFLACSDLGKNKIVWHSLISSLLFVMALSGVLQFIGNKTPILNKIGGSAILCLIIPSFIFTYKFSNTSIEPFQKSVSEKLNFLSSSQNIGFIDFFVVALVSGSLLGIKKNVLKKTFKKFLPLVLVSLMISAIGVGVLGSFLKPKLGLIDNPNIYQSYFIDAIFYIFIPISCGGATCGIIPITEVFSRAVNKDVGGNIAELVKGELMPALLIGGIFSVICAGLIKNIFRKSKYNSPNGQLEKDNQVINKEQNIKLVEDISFDKIKVGFIIIFFLYTISVLIKFFLEQILIMMFSEVVTKFIPPIIIILVLIVILVKIFDLVNSYYISCIKQTSELITTNFLSAVLVLLSMGIDINIIINKVSDFRYLIICISCVLTTALSSAIIGNKLNYYPVQASIAAGLCANSIGGAGNTAILEASDSSILTPYAQISTRLGGDIVVILTAIIYPLLY